MTEKFGTNVYAPVVAGSDTDDDLAVAYGDELGRAIHHFDTAQEMQDFTNKYKSRLYKSWCVVKSDSAWYEWTGTQEDGSDGAWDEIDIGGASGGITINGKLITELQIAPPLQIDSGVGTGGADRLLVDPRAYEEQHAASCLLQLDSDLTMVPGRAAKIYTSHEIIPTGEYYSLNQAAAGVNVQDNTGGDTAVTGGELTRILASVSFYGKATENSNVKAWIWYKDPASPLAGGILEDVNGHPMVVERYYNQGDDMSEPLVIAGAMMATGNAPIVLYVECSAGSYVVNPSQTLLCVEQFSDGYETSLASIEFQRRLAIESHVEIKQFKQTMLSLSDDLTSDHPETVANPGEGYDFINEFGVQNLTQIKASVTGGELSISDNGVIADFYIDAYLDNIKTSMLRGKSIDYDVTIKAPYDAYRLEVYKWTGDADRAGRIYDSRNNGSLILNDGFALVKSKFISENPGSSAVGVTDTATIPDDANNIFIILRPVEAQEPVRLVVQQFKWGVPQPFRGYLETSRRNLREQHLWFSDEWAEFALNNKGFVSLRYTINNTPSSGLPMPVGPLIKGKAPVEIDNTVNQVSGSNDPKNDGAIKFMKDGEAFISKSYNLRNEQGTDNTVTFWDVLIDADGNESKILDSERTFTVPANTGAPGVVYSIPAYVIEVETGQRIGGRALSNKAGGVYIQSDNISQYIVQTEIEFKELVPPGNSGSDDPFAAVDLSQFDRVHYGFMTAEKFVANASSVIFDMDIPEDMNVSVISAVKQLSNDDVRPVSNLDWVYSNANKRLTVSFGETVAFGMVTIGVYI